MKKALFGHLLALGSILFGVLGILMKLAGELPPELDYPIIAEILVALGIIIAGLGYKKALEEGTANLIELIFDFFRSDPYRQLGIVAGVAIINAILQAGVVSGGLETAFVLVLKLIEIVGLGSAWVQYRIRLFAKAKR